MRRGDQLSQGQKEDGEEKKPKGLDEIARDHGLNERETDLFITNMGMLSQGIVDHFTGPDPEDGLETLDIWVETLDMYMTMAPKIIPALREAIEPLAEGLKAARKPDRPSRTHFSRH